MEPQPAPGPSKTPAEGALRRRFPKSRRLRHRRDFLRVQDRSARVTTPHYVLLLAPAPSPGPCRMGIVASKKVGGAVERNRTKRVLREAFRHLPGMFPDGVDLVVIARQGAPEVSFSQACGEMEGVRSLVRRRALEVLRK